MGSLTLKTQNLTNLLPYALDTFNNLYIFKGGAANTIGTVFNKDDFIKNLSSSNSDRLAIFTPDFASSANYWVRSSTNLWTRTSTNTVSTDVVIPENYIIVIFAAGDPSLNLPKSINNGAIVQRYNQGKTSIKKQNLSILKGQGFYPESEIIYIFKSAVNNTLGSIFNYLQFDDYVEVINIYYEGSLSGQSMSFASDGSNWIDISALENADNYVIPANSIIIMNLSSDKNITVGGGAIIQKYYSGKIQLYKFLPNRLQGLSLWLKADAGVTLSGSDVTAWADQSGNGRNATPYNPTDKPLFNASDKNGNPTISLTSMSDELERVFTISSNPLGASGSTAFSVQYVEDVCGAGDDNGPIFGNFGGSETQTHYPYGPDCLVYDAFATTSRKVELTPPTAITATWSIYSVHSTNGEWKDYVNGQLMHSDSSNIYNNSVGGDDTTLYIGKQTANGTFSLKGKVAEVIVYNRVLTTEERQQVEAYLNSKYAIY
jgi:hypothetical protein